MRKFIDEEHDTEVAGYDAIVDILKTQHETTQAWIEMFGEVSKSIVEMLSVNIGVSQRNEESRIEIEKLRVELQRERFEYEKSRDERQAQQFAHKCVTTEDDAGLSKKALASKSSASAKSKAKPRSTKG